jgi:hypothetical protein
LSMVSTSAGGRSWAVAGVVLEVVWFMAER